MPSEVEMSAHEWRQLKRIELAGRPLPFAELRSWSRPHKEFERLKHALAVGLVTVDVDEPAGKDGKAKPEALYDLTPAGRAACALGTYWVEQWGKPGGPPVPALHPDKVKATPPPDIPFDPADVIAVGPDTVVTRAAGGSPRVHAKPAGFKMAK